MGSIQRGYVIAKNDNGTLECIDGTNTYVGSATLDTGRVLTKRFRRTGSLEDVIDRWEKWQGRKFDRQDETKVLVQDEKKEGAMEKYEAIKKCPFSGSTCAPSCPLWSEGSMACSILLGGIGLYNMSCNLARLDMTDPLELIAVAVGEIGSKAVEPKPRIEVAVTDKTAEKGIDLYLEGKTFLFFVNKYARGVFHEYKRLCEDGGYPIVSETELATAIAERYPELIKKGVRGGSMFEAA